MTAPAYPVTPTELARDLGHTDGGRAIRGWLRKHEPRPAIEKYARWAMTVEQGSRIRAAFARRGLEIGD